MTLLEKERAWLDELLDVFDFPTPSLFVLKLQNIMKRIKDDEMIFHQNEELNRIGSPYDAEILCLDPRFWYSDFLIRLHDQIGENIDQFEELTGNNEEIREIARVYAIAYRLRRDEIVGMIDRERQFKPKLFIAFSLIPAPIVGQIIANLIT